MTIEYIYHCDGPDCERHVQTRRDYALMFFTLIEHGDSGNDQTLHFCGWDCILRYAGTKEPEEVVET